MRFHKLIIPGVDVNTTRDACVKYDAIVRGITNRFQSPVGSILLVAA